MHYLTNTSHHANWKGFNGVNSEEKKTPTKSGSWWLTELKENKQTPNKQQQQQKGRA